MIVPAPAPVRRHDVAASRKRNYIAALDAGSRKTCILVAEQNAEGRLQYLGFGAAESKGWKKGAIHNQEAAQAAIRKAGELAERESGIAIERVVVGLGATQVTGVGSRGRAAIASRDRLITQDDVRRTVEEARRIMNLPPGRTVLHAVPHEFLVDSVEGIRHPVGRQGSRLEAEVQVVTAQTSSYDAVIEAVQGAGLEVEEVVFEAMAAADAVLNADDRERGVVLADIGAGSTEVAIYFRDGLRHTFSVPVGGDHFTNDISICMGTPTADAERIKRAFGVAMVEQAAEMVLIEVPGFGERPSRMAPQRDLASILQSRAQELLELIYDELQRSGLHHRIGGGLVLTGGGARLAGLCDLTEQAWNMSARIGLAPKLDGSPESLCEPAYSALAGLLYYGQRLRRLNPTRQAPWWERLRDFFIGR